jgi:hypothetical protein
MLNVRNVLSLNPNLDVRSTSHYKYTSRCMHVSTYERTCSLNRLTIYNRELREVPLRSPQQILSCDVQ